MNEVPEMLRGLVANTEEWKHTQAMRAERERVSRFIPAKVFPSIPAPKPALRVSARV
jgi:hypothetical protein